MSASPEAAPSWAGSGETWAIVTAWNPGGERQERAANERAERELGDELQRLGPGGRVVVNGAGGWAEPARLIPGVRLGVAARLGRQFGQRAVLWGAGARVALVWLAPGGMRVERFWVHKAGPGRP